MAAGAALAATPAAAQEEAPPPPVGVSGAVTLVSDYRLRGISQSGEDPAIQASLNVDHDSGFYAGVFVSTIDGTRSRPGHGDVEFDVYAGYAMTLPSGVGLDAGLLYYAYPDAANEADTGFFEPYATISYSLGPITAKAGGHYGWRGQPGLGGEDTLYLRGDLAVSVPRTPVTLTGHVGHSDGRFGDRFDWSIGAEVAQSFARIGIRYVDTDIARGTPRHAGADPALLGHLTLSF